MAYYEIILIVLIAIISSCITFIVGMRNKELIYIKGWEDAKKVYYHDLRNERIEEEARSKAIRDAETENLLKENTFGYMPLSSDLLMAYGVSTIGQLPKAVRETYNIKENQNSLDLEALIKIEQEDNFCDVK